MKDLQLWAEQIVAVYGGMGLFAIAFIESSFFPIPPDVLLIALVLQEQRPIWLAFICTIGSVIGAMGGYVLGLWGGRPLLFRLFARDKVERVEALYDRYGVCAVLIAAFTPIPYKVFTIASGVFRLNLAGFIGVSIIGRGARFFLVAILTTLMGETVKVWLKRLDVASLLVIALVGLGLGIFACLWRAKKLTQVSKDK